MWAIYIEPDDTLDFFNKFVAFGRNNLHSPGVQNILPFMQQINTFQTYKASGYSTIFSSPWAPHIDIEEKHYEISKAISRWARVIKK